MEHTIKNILGLIEQSPQKRSLYEDCFECIKILSRDNKDAAYKYNSEFRRALVRALRTMPDPDDLRKIDFLHKESYHLEAVDKFDSFLIFLEWNREPSKRFYLPRRKKLKVLVDDLQDLADRRISFLGISLPPRVGKLVSDDTPVLTRCGWKLHGDLVPGDEVISPTGDFVKVTHVFPKAEANIRCLFSDGSRIDVHENHEWVVFNRHKQRHETVETKAMLHDFESGTPGERGHRYYYQVPNKGFLKGEQKNLPVAPYTLGAWLGDGRRTNPDIACSSGDRAMIERIIADGYPVAWHTIHKVTGVEYFGFGGQLRAGLQEYGMCHSRKGRLKTIPEEYLTASVPQRLALLAGLLDSDGTLVRNERRYQFSTSDVELKDSFVSLISTFGWRSSVTAMAPCVSSSGIRGKKTVYTIGFNPTCHIPCVLERKQLFEFSKPRRVAFSGFEKIAPKRGNCICVEGGVYCVGERLVPTHNSTLCILFIAWMMGKYPDDASVMSGHSDKLTDGFYGEVLNIITDHDTYLWHEVFPLVRLADKSAKDESIDLNRKKRFPTLTCRSIEGTLTGAVEISENGVLYSDDLIADLEESLNPDRLQNKYDAYLNQLKDRKKDGALELMVGTRWNVLDPLGRIHDQYDDDPRYRFRVIPAMDENDESNFVYEYGLGFSTEYYRDMRESIDDATWWAKYMGQPYVREGLLFPRADLQWYNGTLPDVEPDKKLAVCDVAWGGGDAVAMPVAYVYGTEIYVHDVVFSDKDKTITQPLVAGTLRQHMPQQVRFEANNGGTEYADKIDELLRASGAHINITSRRAPTTTSKMARIIRYAPDIKRYHFVDDKHSSKEYKAFMREVTAYVMTGKNAHDDAPDSLAQLADFVSGSYGVVRIIDRPF